MSPRPTPWGYEKPEIDAERAESHFCEVTGSTVFAPRTECPFCGPEVDRR